MSRAALKAEIDALAAEVDSIAIAAGRGVPVDLAGLDGRIESACRRARELEQSGDDGLTERMTGLVAALDRLSAQLAAAPLPVSETAGDRLRATGAYDKSAGRTG